MSRPLQIAIQKENRIYVLPSIFPHTGVFGKKKLAEPRSAKTAALTRQKINLEATT